MIIAKQCAIMLIYILLGMLLFKIKLITKEGRTQIAKLLMNVVIPCMLVDTTQIRYVSEIGKKFIFSALLAVGTHVIGIIFARFFIRNDERSERKAIARFCTVFSNAGFLAIPLIKAAYGDEAAFYAISYVLVLNIFSWTYGIIELECGKGKISFKKLINPGVISAVCAIVFYYAKVTLPELIAVPLASVSAINTPLAMILCGAFMAQTDWKKILSERDTYIITVLRLLFIPMITALLYKMLNYTGIFASDFSDVVNISILSAACPTALASSFLPSSLGLDGEYGSSVAVVNTLISMITMPLMAYMVQLF